MVRATRFLLASGVFGKLDQLSWPRKSPTKQQVARQYNPEPPQPTLFETFASEEIAGLEIAPQGDLELDLPTYVVAHSVDPLGRQMELVYGAGLWSSTPEPRWRPGMVLATRSA